jgi:hypothetical protein
LAAAALIDIAGEGEEVTQPQAVLVNIDTADATGGRLCCDDRCRRAGLARWKKNRWTTWPPGSRFPRRSCVRMLRGCPCFYPSRCQGGSIQITEVLNAAASDSTHAFASSPRQNREWLVDDALLRLTYTPQCGGHDSARSKPTACGATRLTSVNILHRTIWGRSAVMNAHCSA